VNGCDGCTPCGLAQAVRNRTPRPRAQSPLSPEPRAQSAHSRAAGSAYPPGARIFASRMFPRVGNRRLKTPQSSTCEPRFWVGGRLSALGRGPSCGALQQRVPSSWDRPPHTHTHIEGRLLLTVSSLQPSRNVDRTDEQGSTGRRAIRA
jgi:hypothetical protein